MFQSLVKVGGGRFRDVKNAWTLMKTSPVPDVIVLGGSHLQVVVVKGALPVLVIGLCL